MFIPDILDEGFPFEEIDIDHILSELEEQKQQGGRLMVDEQLIADKQYRRHCKPHPVHRPSWGGKIDIALRADRVGELDNAEIQVFKCGR